MAKDELFLERDYKAIWQKYCGFLDLSLEEFMEVQKDLLLEEIELVADTPLGKKIMNNEKPSSIDEFRTIVPLTTYEDYAEYLLEKRDDALAEKTYRWVHTSGRSGSFKWAPYTERAFNKAVDMLVAGIILACANKRGQVNLSGKERCVHNVPPRPYFSPELLFSLCERFNFRVVPPPEEAEKMEFHERTAKAFKMSLRTGVDMIGSLSSILVKIGEGFSEGLQGMKISPFMLHPFVLFRLTRALLRSKIHKRPLLPKDLWPVKALICCGTDATVYKDLVVHYWGREPYQFYAGTEFSFSALQSWTKKTLTFTPYCHFIELIPEAEWLKWRDNREYKPATVLLDEVKPGERYEVVATTFYGMPFLRYRVGDLIKIVSLTDEESGINLPQMVFESRADDIIDIAGFARLDEKMVWQAINSTGIRYEDWCIRKEYSEGEPIMHLYIELKDGVSADSVQSLVHESLKAIDPNYSDLDRMLKVRPLRVTLLSRGTFESYLQEKRAAGFDLAHLKPPHMNASDVMISNLLRLSKES
jgi:hypothetical protein